MEGVTTLTSQLHGGHVWDFYNSHVHVSNNLPCNFESFGKKSCGRLFPCYPIVYQGYSLNKQESNSSSHISMSF